MSAPLRSADHLEQALFRAITIQLKAKASASRQERLSPPQIIG
jgi:hypothetical protein